MHFRAASSITDKVISVALCNPFLSHEWWARTITLYGPFGWCIAYTSEMRQQSIVSVLSNLRTSGECAGKAMFGVWTCEWELFCAGDEFTSPVNGEKYYLSACGRGLKDHPVFNTARSLRILFEDILYIQFSNEIDSLGIFFFFKLMMYHF